MNPFEQAALALLRAQLQQGAQLLHLLGGGGSGGGGGGGGGGHTTAGSIASSLLRQLAAVLVPLGGLATILNQTNSGFQLFIGALNIFAATIAPLLLPVFALLAAGVLTVSDILWAQLVPNLKDWYLLILNSAIPAIEEFTNALGDGTEGVTTSMSFLQTQMGVFANFVSTLASKLTGLFGAVLGPDVVQGAAGAAMGVGGQVDKDDAMAAAAAAARGGVIGIGRQKREAREARDGNAGAGRGNFMDKFLNNLDLVTQQLQFTAGSKPSFTGLGEAQKSAQLAALQPPFERIMLERVFTAIKVLQESLAELRKANQKLALPVGVA